MKAYMKIGINYSDKGFLALGNDNAFREFARHVHANRNNSDNAPLMDLFSGVKVPKAAQDEFLRIAVNSECVDSYILNVKGFLKNAEETTRLKTNQINFGNEEIGEAVDPASLSPDQKRMIELVDEGYNVYIGGSAGTGKTVVLRECVRRLRLKRLSVGITATTGVAAVNINGYTFHSVFGLNGLRTDYLESLDVVVVDEVSMLQSGLLEAMEYAARKARRSDEPFGGLQIILCGDFMQLGGIPNHPLFHCELFMKRFVRAKLTTVHRLKNRDNRFADQMKEIRLGFLPPDMAETITILKPHEPLPDDCADATFMFPLNETVKAHNLAQLEKLPDTMTWEFSSNHTETGLLGDWTDTYIVDTGTKCKSTQEWIRSAVRDHILASVMEVDLPQVVVAVFPLEGEDAMECTKYAVRAQVMSIHVKTRDGESRTSKLEQDKRNLSLRVEAALEHLKLTIQGKQDPNLIPLHMQRSLYDKAQADIFAEPLLTKTGARVMLRWNLSKSLVNGSVGLVMGYQDPNTYQLPAGIDPKFYDNVQLYCNHLRSVGVEAPQLPVIRFNTGEEIMVPPVKMIVGGSDTEFFSSYLLVLPLSLGYAFTVHKVQGLTLKGRVVLDLKGMFPCPHLIYVAFTRVREQSQLVVRNLLQTDIAVDAAARLFDESLVSAECLGAADLSALARTNRGDRSKKTKQGKKGTRTKKSK